MIIIDLWAAVIGLVMMLYVILDGMTLGVGLLFAPAADEDERDIMINTIAPVWDANQTWLVFGGGAVFAVFPLIYAILSSALYIPLMTFIMGLIFRGVTFEFRSEKRRKLIWDRAFCIGSLVAVVSQGLMLGGILTGIKVSEGQFAGGPFDWFNPFSLMVGLALIPGYIMLGSTYLIIKTTGPVQNRAFTYAFWSALAVLGFMGIVTIWTPVHYPFVREAWFSTPRIYFIWAFPLMGLIAAYKFFRAVKKRRELVPLICAVILFLSGYFGLVLSFYPYAIPVSVTIREAAAQLETMQLALWGAAIVLPVIMAYVIYSYVVFRGKVDGTGFYGP